MCHAFVTARSNSQSVQSESLQMDPTEGTSPFCFTWWCRIGIAPNYEPVTCTQGNCISPNGPLMDGWFMSAKGYLQVLRDSLSGGLGMARLACKCQTPKGMGTEQVPLWIGETKSHSFGEILNRNCNCTFWDWESRVSATSGLKAEPWFRILPRKSQSR